MPVPLIQEDTGDLWNKNAGDYLPSTTWDAALAAANLAADKTSLGIAGDFYLKNKFDSMELQKELSVEELNQKYMGSGITWTGPQKEITAAMIAKKHEQDAMWSNRAAMGNGVVNFGTGLLVGAGDPAMFLGGKAIGMALKGSSMVPAFLKGESLLPSLSRGAVEGAAVMAPLEVGDVLRNRAYERDVSMTESLKNIAMGGAFGATLEGIGFAAREFPGYIKSASEKFLPRGAKVEDNARAVEMAAGQLELGKRPNINPVIEAFSRERSGEGPRPPGYEHLDQPHIPVDASQPVTKEYYLGSHSQVEQLHLAAADGQHGNASTDFGQGLYGSDSLAAENGYAASSFGETAGSPGLIHRFETQQAKLFDTERPLTKDEAQALAPAIAPIDKQIAKDLVSGDLNLRQAYDHLSMEAKNELNKRVETLGYDGLHFKDGTDAAPRNGVMMFPDKAENARVTGEPIQADPSVKGGLTESELSAANEKMTAPESEVLHSVQENAIHENTVKRIEEGAAKLDDDTYLADQHKEAMDFIKIAEEKGLLSEADKALVQEILGSSNEGFGPSLKDKESLANKTLKAMANCIVEH